MGLGSYLLNHVLMEVKKSKFFRRVILNVRTSNLRALKLYKSYNFHIIREIDNYYRKGNNSYLMELKQVKKVMATVMDMVTVTVTGTIRIEKRNGIIYFHKNIKFN